MGQPASTSICWPAPNDMFAFHLFFFFHNGNTLQGGLVAQPSGGSWGRPGSAGSRPGTAGSYRASEAPPSPSKLATLQQTSLNKANSGALSEVSLESYFAVSSQAMQQEQAYDEGCEVWLVSYPHASCSAMHHQDFILVTLIKIHNQRCNI